MPSRPRKSGKSTRNPLGTRGIVKPSLSTPPSHRGNGHDTSQSGPLRNPEVRNGNFVCPPVRVRKPNKRETTSSDAVVVLPRKFVVFSRDRSPEDGSNSVTSPPGHGEQGKYASSIPAAINTKTISSSPDDGSRGRFSSPRRETCPGHLLPNNTCSPEDGSRGKFFEPCTPSRGRNFVKASHPGAKFT